MSWTLLGIFVVLSLLGVPLAVSLGLAVVATILAYDLSLSIVPQAMYTSMNSFLLVAVPLFILAGTVMEKGGVADRIFSAANSAVGRWRGGLGNVNIIASMIFGGISGSSVADVASLGPLEVKAMTARNYPKDYAAGLTLVTSTLASVVPPSILMIIAAATAGQSIGAALAGGIGPAIVLGAAFFGINYTLAVKRGYGEVFVSTYKDIAKAMAIAIPAIGAPVIILSGIFQGFVTPTEAAALAVVYTLIIGRWVYRELRWRDLPPMLVRSGTTTGTILFIAMAAGIATRIFAMDGLPQQVSDIVLSISENPIIVLLLLGVVFVVVGMVMDIIAAIFLLTPVLMPTVLVAGIDPLHFVVFMIAALSVGLTTPPVGVCLFATAFVTGMRIEDVARAAVPFYIALVVALTIIALVPQLTLWPVSLLVN
jgi:tripartite ATP-independent transporter DctM subunit